MNKLQIAKIQTITHAQDRFEKLGATQDFTFPIYRDYEEKEEFSEAISE